ncbi:hypothetical protein MMC12_006911 [Toensbergia leucococca]|nr:hypothetical protein [Toensbergia leucococca]
MDRPWSLEAWKPTAWMSVFDRPSDEVKDSHTKQLARLLIKRQVFKHDAPGIMNLTRKLRDLPYNPDYWYMRAHLLSGLGYPELAAGDAHKAYLLINAALADETTVLGEHVKLYYAMDVWLRDVVEWRRQLPTDLWKFRIRSLLIDSLGQTYKALMTALFLANATWDFLRICKEAKEKFPSESHYGEEFQKCMSFFESQMVQLRSVSADAKEVRRRLLQGGITIRPYPFMEKKYLRRDNKLIGIVEKELKTVSSRCALAWSPIRGQSKRISMPSDVLGIFATCDIAPSELLFVDKTVTAATNVSTTSSPNGPPTSKAICECCCGTIASNSKRRSVSDCCSTVYCSKECLAQARNSYHQALCGKDFNWLFGCASGANDAQDPGLQGPFWLRISALCAQSNSHPLHHPRIARLTAQYARDEPEVWSFATNIVQPNKILQQLRIDIFTDARYDTWILQTAWSRLMNNRHAHVLDQRTVLTVNPLFSFFNHSCDPNAKWKPSEATSKGGSTLVLHAIRPIGEGEEIFVSYIEASDFASKAQRQRMLLPWLGAKCECSRCRRE